MKSALKYLKKIILTGGLAWILWGACAEFYQIASGTGEWSGDFSRTWLVLYYAFIFINLLLLLLFSFFVWRREIFSKYIDGFIVFRGNLGNFRWVLWLAVFIAPVFIFQFTAWGVVLQKFYIRSLVWIIVICLLSIFASSDEHLSGWREFLSTLILTSSLYTITSSLMLVNDFPFSQGWSEGNRLWDYSILFGRDRFLIPQGKDIPVLLDFGRQFIGGLPFLIPGISIRMVRLWVGLTQIIPYLLLGAALFRNFRRDKMSWLLLTFWTFLFLKQGPIHPPLVICAALVALAWQAPLGYAIPLVVGAGYFAETSRFTWMFAPGLWIFMLEITSASFTDRKSAAPVFKRAVLLAALGIFGGVFLPNIAVKSQNFMQELQSPVIVSTLAATPVVSGSDEVVITPAPGPNIEDPYPPFIDFVIKMMTVQPLLWYRLLPNSTYGNGILFALVLAVGPLVVILLALIVNKVWKINWIQRLSLLLPLAAFLTVGLVASTKIGGGGDLHNMDMFLISLLLMGALAWKNGANDWLLNGPVIPGLIKGVLIFSLVISGLGSLQAMRPFDFGKDAVWIKTLTDASSERALGMLPLKPEIDSALQAIQQAVDAGSLKGDVLFMDQRQLLTFRYISGVAFVPEYEKKYLMNEALSENSTYFEPFYADLASHRFSLIISEPLRTPIKDSSYQFGEENNAWVKWVSNPVLCYYEEKDTLKEVGVQLLVPKSGPVDCSAEMP